MKTLVSILVAFIVFGSLAVGCGDDGISCSEGMAARDVCVMCGPAGGCAEHATRCAKACSTNDECASSNLLFGCFGGVCQVGGCE